MTANAQADAPWGVIWDMDGVLVDTGEAHYQSWAAALAEFSLPCDRETFRATFGQNNASILRLVLGARWSLELAVEIAERKEALFRADVHGRVIVLPGVPEWLARLPGQGARQAIASSAPQANIDAILDELGWRKHFDAVVSAANLPGKPDPAVFRLAAEQAGLPPARCLVVEDAVAGVAGARRAGMRCLAVTTTNPASALAEADRVVDRLDVLPADAFRRLALGE